uniref:TolC family protein n=1 Tax=Dialister sp. TaxID=1955814 RepID=UPI004024BCA7
MNTMTCKILTASIVLALSCGLGAEAKGSKTKIMTDPSITQKAIEAQMNQTVANKDVNFNNMLLQKNLASSITEAAAPEAAAMDIDLKGAVTTAIQNNRDITIAELKRREAEADVSAAAAKKNPSVSYSWQRNQYPTQVVTTGAGTQSSNHRYSQGINVSWDIWTFGKVEGAIDAARYQKNIADLNVYKTEADTKLAAVQAYYQYLEAIKLAEVQAQSVTDYASHLNNVQQQFDAGIVAKLDVLSSNVSLANAKQKSIAADNTRDVAEANLNNIMRVPMNTTLNPLDKNFPEPEFDLTMEQAILMAQKYRWELVEADYGVKAAEASLRSAKARYLPTVSVGGGYSWKEASVTAVDKDDWAVQGGLSWSLWDGGATQASVKKADAAVKTAQETLLQAREKIELEVRQDYLNVLSYKEQIRAAEASVAQAEEAYKIATVRYSSGVGINLDVLDAELALNTARTNYITALYNYNIGLATLEHAMGVPAVIHPEFAKA